MSRKDFFQRDRLLPKRKAQPAEPGSGANSPTGSPSDVPGEASSQGSSEGSALDADADAVAAVFDRPTLVPHLPAEELAARTMQHQADAETATTARAPRLPSKPAPDGEPELNERVTLSTDDLPVGGAALVHAHRSTHQAVRPPPVSKVEAPVSGTSETQPALSSAQPSSAFPESGLGALGFVDSLPRTTGQPPARAASDKPPAATVAGPTLSLADMYAVGDFSGALREAERRLTLDPLDADAQRFAQDCRRVLVKMQLARLGSLAQVVHLGVTTERLQWLSIDHRSGFLLSLVDGRSTLEDLLDICGMARLEALQLFSNLADQGIILLKLPAGA